MPKANLPHQREVYAYLVTELSTILALLFAISCGLIAANHSHRVGRVTLLDWSLLAMGGVYGLGWILVLDATIQGLNPLWAPWILPFDELFIWHSIASVLLLVGVVLGWRICSALQPTLPTYRSSEENVETNPRPWRLAFWICLALGSTAQVLYSRAYGGLIAQLEYSDLVRSAAFESLPDNAWSFLYPVSSLVLIAALGFFGLLLSGYWQVSNMFGVVLALPASLFVLFNALGRLPFVTFVASLVLAIAILKHNSPIKLLFGAIIVGAAILSSAYWISAWLELKPADSLAEFVSRELSFPFGGFFAQMSEGENLFRGFRDLLVIPVFVLPTSMWSNWVESVSQINTALIMGAPKGYSGVTAGIPVDLITLGIMQLHLPGIAVVGILFGTLLRLTESLLALIPYAGVRSAFEASLALSLAVMSVFYAQPNLIVANHMHWLLAGVICISVLAWHRNGVAR
jgi:hypothetical protein